VAGSRPFGLALTSPERSPFLSRALAANMCLEQAGWRGLRTSILNVAPACEM